MDINGLLELSCMNERTSDVINYIMFFKKKYVDL